MPITYKTILRSAIDHFNSIQDKVSNISGTIYLSKVELKSISAIVGQLENIYSEIQTQEGLIKEIDAELKNMVDNNIITNDGGTSNDEEQYSLRNYVSSSDVSRFYIKYNINSNIDEELEFEEGMTWVDWFNSEYNPRSVNVTTASGTTDQYSIQLIDDIILIGDHVLKDPINVSNVIPSEKIIADREYSLQPANYSPISNEF